ncbi:hypothetical protein OMP38_07280 [Cohnella ginsengisoli]|uniref:Uncharacterized protein n=1 Tax=Cohnella ginsengisoli TaxID=425004 RepID=A0A9X4KEJ0_9BACL|nr:hypothetical protein [Cohnella ginsengisoli]MDG0790679.1 hypothetical protein [Cohnella ginsengisoli]
MLDTAPVPRTAQPYIMIVIPASRIGAFVLYDLLMSTLIYAVAKHKGSGEWTAIGLSSAVPLLLRRMSYLLEGGSRSRKRR